jgi:integrase
MVSFNEDESATIRLHGIKNDTDRSGFEVVLPAAKDACIDPVKTLKDYITRTNNLRSLNNRAVFLTLREPFTAIKSDTVGNILCQAIKLAGLQGYSAKDFRPTGATVAINNGVDPKIVQRLGRWKTDSVFFEHYVHSKPPET